VDAFLAVSIGEDVALHAASLASRRLRT
jgi:hypothetical protein